MSGRDQRGLNDVINRHKMTADTKMNQISTAANQRRQMSSAHCMVDECRPEQITIFVCPGRLISMADGLLYLRRSGKAGVFA